MLYVLFTKIFIYNISNNSHKFDGSIYFTDADNVTCAVRPVVYLSSDVEIESGTGAELNPYVLKINNN